MINAFAKVFGAQWLEQDESAGLASLANDRRLSVVPVFDLPNLTEQEKC